MNLESLCYIVTENPSPNPSRPENHPKQFHSLGGILSDSRPPTPKDIKAINLTGHSYA